MSLHKGGLIYQHTDNLIRTRRQHPSHSQSVLRLAPQRLGVHPGIKGLILYDCRLRSYHKGNDFPKKTTFGQHKAVCASQCYPTSPLLNGPTFSTRCSFLLCHLSVFRSRCRSTPTIVSNTNRSSLTSRLCEALGCTFVRAMNVPIMTVQVRNIRIVVERCSLPPSFVDKRY